MGTKHKPHKRHAPKLAGAKDKVRVRCLGPLSPEHTFLSEDPRRFRVCPRCVEHLRGVRLSPHFETVYSVGSGREPLNIEKGD